MSDLTTTETVSGEVIATIDLGENDAFNDGVKLRAESETGGFTVGGSDVEGTYKLVRVEDS